MRTRLLAKRYQVAREKGLDDLRCRCGTSLWARARRGVATRLLFPESRLYHCYDCAQKTLVLL